MAQTKYVVDHLALEYEGVLDTKAFFKLLNGWFAERLYQKKEDKNHEQTLDDGKHIEYEISPWKKISDYHKYIFKIRVIIKKLNKVEVMVDNKKKKVDHGKVSILFDGILEKDYNHRWDDKPLFVFFRTLFDGFIYKTYTERFEHRLTKDIHSLYQDIERFFNMYRSYSVVSKTPYF